MRSFPWPLARHLSLLVLGVTVPAAWTVGALAVSLYQPGWQAAFALTMGVVALGFGAHGSFLMLRDLEGMLADLATEAGLLARGMPLSHTQPIVSEAVAISDALADAAEWHDNASDERTAREAAPAERSRGEWRWDLVNGTMRWNVAADRLLRLGSDTVPSLSQLISVICPGDRARVAAWLAALARGVEMDACEFRVMTGGVVHCLRAAATLRRDNDGTLTGISGTFTDLAAAPEVVSARAAVGPLVESAAMLLRDHGAAAGLTVVTVGKADAAVDGDGYMLGNALSLLVQRAIMSAPRGGSAGLRTDYDAVGNLRIVLTWAAAGANGMDMASVMVELQSGVRNAQILDDARAVVQSCGGTVTAERDPRGETVTIILPVVRTLRQAA